MHARASDAVATPYPPVVQIGGGLAVDASGNRYVAGTFSGAPDFNPLVGADIKTSSGGTDCFVTRFNADGTYAWTQIFGGSATDVTYGLTVSGGTVYVTGDFNSGNAGIGGTGALASSGNFDAWVIALDAATGAAQTGFGSSGMQKFGGAGPDSGLAIAESGGTLYVTGQFNSANAGIGGTGGFSTSGAQDVFVIALDAATGAAQAGFGSSGMQKFGGSGVDSGRHITIVGGTVYGTGEFASANAGIGGTGGFGTSGSTDAFVFALNAGTGAAQAGFGSSGMQKFGGTGAENSYGVVVSGGTLYLAGGFGSADAGIGGTGGFGTSGGSDGFVIALDKITGAAQTGFGSSGMQKFGGTGTDNCFRAAASGGTVYAIGTFQSGDADIGGTGAFGSSGSDDVFVIALDEATGAAQAGFGSGGKQKFGGTLSDSGSGVAAAGGVVYLSGATASTNAGIGGTGSIDSTSFGGFLLLLDAGTAAFIDIPVITSTLTDSGINGTAYTYNITATNSPTSFNATGLPAGLSVNTGSGAITGTPNAAGGSSVALSATNLGYVGTATLSLTINNPPPPVITSPTTAAGTVGVAFTYTITATNNPASFSAAPLPAGLSVNTSTGDITGTPTAAGFTSVSLGATNPGGTGNATLMLTVNPPPPVITSPTTTTGTVGMPFTFTITATNNPASFSAAPLPAGLSVNTSTGDITGTPTAAGFTSVTLGATNPGGTGNAALTLTVNPPPPVITSPTTAAGTVGVAFTYTIAATNNPASFSAAPLPAGLSVNTSTGDITGTPTAAGVTSVTLGATNAGGTGNATLTLTVNAGVPIPAISSPLAVTGTTGVAFNYSITATNAPASFNATPLPAGLTVNTATGVISGTPLAAGAANVGLSATNAAGTGTATLVVTVGVSAPVITGLAASTSSARVGVPVNYTASATDADGDPLTYTWNFGDGQPGGTGASISHTFVTEGAFIVTLTVSDGSQSATATFSMDVFAPASGGSGVTNIAQDDTPVENPVSGIKIEVTRSEGGVVEFSIDPSNLFVFSRAAFEQEFSISTDFVGILGRVGPTRTGSRPVAKFSESGLYVADSRAIKRATGQEGKARKTVPVSRRETGQPPVITALPDSSEISIRSMKGKFLFAQESPDAVSLSGSIELPSGMDTGSDQQIFIGIGNVLDSVIVDARGRQKGASALGRIKNLSMRYPKNRKARAGALTDGGQSAKFSVTYSTANMDVLGFDTEGISMSRRPEEEQQRSLSRNVQIAMVVAGVAYETTAPVQFKISGQDEVGQFIGARSARGSFKE